MEVDNNMVNPCHTCGNVGFSHSIITCCECKSSREHLYCMRIFRTEIPQFWVCDECHPNKKLPSSDQSVKDLPDSSMKANFPDTGMKVDLPAGPMLKSSNLVHHGTGVPAVVKKTNYASRFNFKEKRAPDGKTKYLPCDEVVKLSSGTKKVDPALKVGNSGHGSMPPPRERTPVKPKPASRSFAERVNPTPRFGKVGGMEPGGHGSIQLKQTSQQPVVQPSSILKANNSAPSSRNGADAERTTEATKVSERAETNARNSVLPTRNEAKARPSLEALVSSKKVGTRTKDIEVRTAKHPVVHSRNEVDDGWSLEGPKSSERVETTNTEIEMKTGGKNNTNVGVGSSAEKPNQEKALATVATHSSFVPAQYAYWKGIFHLPNGLNNLNDKFKAHPPARVHIKVYETLRNMPEDLHFELVQHPAVRMETFRDRCPDMDDIGMYFFPIFKEGSEKYVSILNYLWTQNVALKSCLGGLELLVLSSRLLQSDSQRFRGDYFLWGFFRRVKRQNIEKTSPSSTSDIAPDCYDEGKEVVDMDIDVEDEGPITRLPMQVKSEPSADVPPGFESMPRPHRG